MDQPLTSAEWERIAHVVSGRCRASVEDVEVVEQLPTTTETYLEEVAVTRPREHQVEHTKPGWGLGAGTILAGAILSFFVGSALGVAAGVLLLLVFGIIGWVVAGRFGSTTSETVTRDEEVIEKVEREREVAGETVIRIEKRTTEGARIKAIGVVNLSFVSLEIDDRPLLLDLNGITDPVELKIPHPRNVATLRSVISAVTELQSTVPYVLGEGAKSYRAPDGVREAGQAEPVVLRGREVRLKDQLDSLARELKSRKRIDFRLPLVAPDSLLWEVVRDGAREAEAGNFRAGKEFFLWRHSDAGALLDLDLKDAAREMTIGQFAITGARFATLEGGIAPLCKELGEIFHYSSFNFYCPSCNDDTQQDLLSRTYSVRESPDHQPISYPSATRCEALDGGRVWRCRSCGEETASPIPVHEVLDEALTPTYDRLMDEHKTDRLSVYARARDSELEYNNQLEREMEELVQRARTSADQVEQRVREVEAEIEGEKAAISAFEDVREAYAFAQTAAMAKVQSQYQLLIRRLGDRQVRTRQELDKTFDRVISDALKTLEAQSKTSYVEQATRDQHLLQIARNTGDIAESSRANLAVNVRNAEFNRQSAESNARTASASEKNFEVNQQNLNVNRQNLDVNRQSLDVGRKNLAANQQSAAANTRTAEATESSATFLEQGNAISAAMAEKAGVKRHASFTNPIGGLKDIGARVASTVIHEDAVDTAKRRERALS